MSDTTGPRGAWRKSAHSGNGANCVEIAVTDAPITSPNAGPHYLIRDSKTPGTPPLAFTQPEWRAFVAAIKSGELNPS